MKPDTAPTLSQHLLNEASKFFLYPKRKRRTKATLESLEWIDNVLMEFVEWRKTFAPDPKYLGNEKRNDPTFLDELYCRDLLRAIPEMVRRTRALAELALPSATNSESLVYLRESASCLIFGLSQAAVALARAAVESHLREAYSKLPGNETYAARNIKLDDLISNLSKLFNLSKGAAGLSPDEESWARCVQKAGNNVRHDSQIEAEEALRVFEAARSMIQSMRGKARP